MTPEELEQMTEVMRAFKVPRFDAHLHGPVTTRPDRFAGSYLPKSSQVRATMAAMDHDAITAGLWALAGFDPALVHFAELREHLRTLPEEHQSRISLDRALSVYLEGQCSELLRGAGITKHDMDLSIDIHLGNLDTTTADVLGCTDDPLAMEIFGYALHLGVLTAHGTAPWKRYAAVMSECYQIMHPVVAVP